MHYGASVRRCRRPRSHCVRPCGRATSAGGAGRWRISSRSRPGTWCTSACAEVSPYANRGGGLTTGWSARPLAPFTNRTLNEGRGLNPGDTSTRPSSRSATWSTLNEGRGLNPGDTRGHHGTRCSTGPLNEGRGLNPGDTGSFGFASSMSKPAQRRPGPKPRRHS